MSHSIEMIITFTGCLTVALLFGFVTQKMKLSPIVGYLIAGIIVGPYSPGFVANTETSAQFAEIGVILLMFGVGLQFHLKDLIAVKNIAVNGALVQILGTTITAMIIMHFLGFSWFQGCVFGVAISVASTVVLLRVLTDYKALHTSTGHIAIGWLVVEDLFTILVLVLLPIIASVNSEVSIFSTFFVAVFKLLLLVTCILFIGQKILPVILNYVAKTGSRDLFTLAILVLALGIAVGASELFGASMALGAFLAGMIVGQSDFSARAASEALPMRDAFAVLFFVSIGMLFNPVQLLQNWQLALITLFIVLILKPLFAIAVVLLLKQSLKKAVSVGIALAQIGEFSFILITLGIYLDVLDQNIFNVIIVTAIISITFNPLLYKGIEPFFKWLKKTNNKANDLQEVYNEEAEESCVILVGYGPVGKTIAPILLESGARVVVLEMNINTVKRLKKEKREGLCVIYGDATQKEILLQANIECAQVIVVSSMVAPAKDIIEVAKYLNPKIKTLVHTTYLCDKKLLKQQGADVVFSGEEEVAHSMSNFILTELGTLIDIRKLWNIKANEMPDEEI